MIKKNIAVFISTYETMRAEKILEEKSITVKPVIKPRSIESQCGMALEFDDFLKEKVTSICYDNKLGLVGIYN